MASNPWVYEERAGRYRNAETGRFIGPKAMLALRDQFTAAMIEKARGMATTEPAAVGQWLTDMRGLLKSVFVDQYVLAKGGRTQMEQADWGRVGYMIRKQYGFLQNMAQDAIEGKMSGAQMGNRAGMYVEAGTAAYEKAAAGDLALPAYPADGSTECLSRCKCSWDITETDTGYEATWTLGDADHCGDCEQRAADWAPLIIPK